MPMQQESPKGAQAPSEAMLQTNSSLKLSRWLHAYGELLRCGSTLSLFRIPSGSTLPEPSSGLRCSNLALLASFGT